MQIDKLFEIFSQVILSYWRRQEFVEKKISVYDYLISIKINQKALVLEINKKE